MVQAELLCLLNMQRCLVRNVGHASQQHSFISRRRDRCFLFGGDTLIQTKAAQSEAASGRGVITNHEMFSLKSESRMRCCRSDAKQFPATTRGLIAKTLERL